MMNLLDRLLAGFLERRDYAVVPTAALRDLERRAADAERLAQQTSPAAAPPPPPPPAPPPPAEPEQPVVHPLDESQQVPDDVALLDLMLADQAKQHELYGTTNYYLAYDAESIPYLRNVGLRNFRTVAPSTISSFGAVDSRMAPPDDLTIRLLMYANAEKFGIGSSARPLKDVEISRRGNPQDYFEMDGRCLTPRSLMYYMRYGYVGRYLDWSKVRVMAELGPGVGTQTEVIAQLHPDMSILLLDIPPQLYVCEAYLKAVFGDRVVSYRETRALKPGFRPEPGRIYILGNWQMELLAGTEVDLFWSAAALCATEPDVADNYLRIINQSSVPAAYLMENFKGLYNAAERGKSGVIEKTTMETYLRGLSAFDLVDKSPHPFSDGVAKYDYDNSIWFRKGGGGPLRRA